MTELAEQIATAVLDHCYGSAHVNDDMIEQTAKVVRAILATPQQAGGGLTDMAAAEALHSVVAAIYFQDSSDYLSALWSVVRNLAPELVHELREYPKRAFDQSMKRVEDASAAPRQPGEMGAGIGEYPEPKAVAFDLNDKGIHEPTEGMYLSAEDVQFLATRLRRLFSHFNYPLPKFADNSHQLIGIAPSCIGAVLANLTKADEKRLARGVLDDLERKGFADSQQVQADAGAVAWRTGEIVWAVEEDAKRHAHWNKLTVEPLYAHPSPAVESDKRDAERYQAIRDCGDEWSDLPVFDSRGELDPEFLDQAADGLVAAMSREQSREKGGE